MKGKFNFEPKIVDNDVTPRIENKHAARIEQVKNERVQQASIQSLQPNHRGVSHGPPGTHREPEQKQKQMGVRFGSDSNMENKEPENKYGIQPAHKIIIPNDDPTKTSTKRTGVIRAYAANTN